MSRHFTYARNRNIDPVIYRHLPSVWSGHRSPAANTFRSGVAFHICRNVANRIIIDIKAHLQQPLSIKSNPILHQLIKLRRIALFQFRHILIVDDAYFFHQLRIIQKSKPCFGKTLINGKLPLDLVSQHQPFQLICSGIRTKLRLHHQQFHGLKIKTALLPLVFALLRARQSGRQQAHQQQTKGNQSPCFFYHAFSSSFLLSNIFILKHFRENAKV